MKTIRMALLAAGLGTLAAASVGQESAPPAQSPPASQPAAPSADKPAEPASNGSAQQQPAAQPRGVVREDEFIPTQEVQADEEVTFPVDI
jgi:hypothetical protein